MTINFDETTAGSLPDRWGEIGAIVALVRGDWRTDGDYWTAFGNLENVLAGGVTASGDIQHEHDLRQYVHKLFDDARASMVTMVRGLQWLAKELVKRHIGRDTGQFELIGGNDNPLGGPDAGPGGGGASFSSYFGGVPTDRGAGEAVSAVRVLKSAFTELRRQMADQAGTAPDISVKTCTVTATATAYTSNTGNGICLVSTLRGDGLSNPHIMGTKARLSCVRSGYDRDGVQFNEEFLYEETTGPSGADPDWGEGTRGTGHRMLMRVADPTAWATELDGTRRNMLSNAFETFVGNHPNNWVKVVGTAGTDYQASTAQFYFDDYSLLFIAGTSVKTELKQVFSDQGGSPAKLKGSTCYALCFRLRATGTITAGVLRARLTNSSGTTLNDDQGVACSLSVTLSAVSSSAWSNHTEFFRTPKNVEDDAEFHFDINTNLTGANLYLDGVVLTEAYRPHGQAPYIALISGNTQFVSERQGVVPDYFDLVYTNNNGGAAHARATYQRLIAALCGTPALDVVLPEAASPSWADAEIA